MAVDLLPDPEKVTGDYLRAHTDVAALVGDRVATKIPDTPTWPLLRLTRIGGTSAARNTLEVARMQFEGWADDEPTARLVTATVRAALEQAPGYVHADGYITAVGFELGPIPIPDPETSRPRYLLQAVVYLR